MSCIRPIAPFGETAWGLKPDSPDHRLHQVAVQPVVLAGEPDMRFVVLLVCEVG